jgi:hypothetical protein
MHSFLRALEHEQKSSDTPPLPFEDCQKRYFAQCGLFVYNNDIYTAIVGLKKGGVITISSKEKVLFVDCGYRVNLRNYTIAATNWQDPAYNTHTDGNFAEVYGKMNKIHLKESTPFLLTGLRIVSFFLGRTIIGFLKNQLIFVKKHANIYFHRTITFESEEIIIKDKLTSPKPVIYKNASNSSLRHVASGKFFAITDLLNKNQKNYNYKSILITRKYNCKTGTLHETLNTDAANG